MPTALAQPAAFYDREWSDRWLDMKTYSPVARHTRRLIRAHLDRLRFNSLIDIGCGNGQLLRDLELDPSAVSVCGLDFSPEAVSLARASVPGTFVVADIQSVCPDLRADVGVCSEVLEHLDQDEAALRNIREMVRHLIVTVPSGPLGDAALRMGHVRHYTKEDLSRKLRDAGFTVRHIRAWGTPFHDPLYAWLRGHAPEGSTTGRYGIARRTLSRALYGLFHLNVFDRGHKLIALAERAEGCASRGETS